MLMDLYRDSSGNFSMYRVLAMYIVLNMMMTWTVCCIKSGGLLDFGESNTALIAAVLFGKAVQKFGEK